MNTTQEKAIWALKAISEPDSQIALTNEVAEYLEVDLWDDSEIVEERRIDNDPK